MVVFLIVFILATVSSILLFTTSGYLFSILKFFPETDWFDKHVPNFYSLKQIILIIKRFLTY